VLAAVAADLNHDRRQALQGWVHSAVDALDADDQARVLTMAARSERDDQQRRSLLDRASGILDTLYPVVRSRVLTDCARAEPDRDQRRALDALDSSTELSVLPAIARAAPPDDLLMRILDVLESSGTVPARTTTWCWWPWPRPHRRPRSWPVSSRSAVPSTTVFRHMCWPRSRRPSRPPRCSSRSLTFCSASAISGCGSSARCCSPWFGPGRLRISSSPSSGACPARRYGAGGGAAPRRRHPH
jgi:hypothetical protein